MPTTEAAELVLADPQSRRVTRKAAFFVRTNPKGVQEKTVEQDVSFGEVLPGALENFKALVADLFVPIVREQADWGKSGEDSTQEFLNGAVKYGGHLADAVSSLHGGVELSKVDKRYLEIELKPQALNKAAQDPDVADYMEQLLEVWCKEVEALLEEGTDGARKESDEIGPNTELDFWRAQMSKFNSLTEQLKTKECKIVLGVCTAGRTKAHRSWKNIDLKLTDAANEAKDNVKYLSTLEKSLEPMYQGTPNSIIDSLPSLLNNIKMMHTIARYYNTPERMTVLFTKITNQMILNSKAYIVAPGKLWDQDKLKLIQNMGLSLKLKEAYQEQYKLTRDRLLSQPKGKQFDFDESKIFGRLELFCKRVSKLIDVFTTVHQFSVLATHTHIDGLEQMIKNFFGIVDDFKKKSYDLLDYRNSQFDRDYLEFNVNIHELETALQGFINESFDSITSTENALNLLRQFQSILQRETLKQDLDDKYMVIFQNYGLDLEAVQKLYEKHKSKPPIARYAPPVAGNIMWSRQLLRRVEEPMKKFASNKNIMGTKESKRIIRTYNRVAKALIEFETLWQQAWSRSIEMSKAGLHATLLVRHPETGGLLVNFDREIMQLMREAKYLQRIGVEVPDSAKMVLLQEEKFKHYFNELTYAVSQYEEVMESIPKVARALMQPHVDDLERKVQPGMFILTWTSMNIDGYLHRIHRGLARLRELIKAVSDCIENRIDGNLKAMSKIQLVDLPTDRSFTFEEFIALQSKKMKGEGEFMRVRNVEVSRAVNDLVELIANFPRENTEVPLPEEEAQELKAHYSKLMYEAILRAVKKSLHDLKERVGSKSGGGFLFVQQPFFNVGVELTIPSVSLVPSLDEIQGVVNSAAKKVLLISQNLDAWGRGPNGPATFHELVAADKEVVKSVLALTGSIEGTKQQALDYVDTFSKYSFLWKQDMQAEYNAFMKKKPSMEDFEGELKKYLNVEHEVAKIPSIHNIGSLSLLTQPMKYSLKAEAAAWKAQFAKNLHAQGQEDLEAFMEYIRETTVKLNRKIEDLEDVRLVMGILQEVREKESEIDDLITPIEEMYALLGRYEVRVPKEETDTVQDMGYSWKKLVKLSAEVGENLSRLQVGFKKDLVKEVKLFVVDAVSFRNDWEANGPMVSGLDPMEATNRLKKFQQQFEIRKRKWDGYSAGEELFGITVTQYPQLEQTEKEINLLDRLYSLYVDAITTINGYGDMLWADVMEQLDGMIEQTTSFQSKCKKLPKALRDWQAYKDCKQKIEDFLGLLPVFQQLAHKAIRNRHWQDIMRITGHQLNLQEDVFKLQDLLDANLLANLEEVEETAGAAVKEEQIEVKLAQIGEEWQDLQLSFAEYKTRGPVILKASDIGEITEKLEDTQMTLSSMSTNRYSMPFREEVNTWISKLSTVSEIIEQWIIVQNMWMYMEAVFSGGDIVKQLPQEAKRFSNIDKNYMKIVQNALEVMNVVQTCYGNELMKSLLPHLLEQLELCQKSLSAYLEQKRAEFPRFYFVSDPTLLEILSLGSNPQAVQPHFQSGLFDSLTAVTFDKNDKSLMTEMFSPQNEKVVFEAPVKAAGNIEVWLQSLVDGMQDTVKANIKRAYTEVNEQSLEDFIFGHPAQVSLLGIQFLWTADNQTALASSKTEKNVMTKCMKKTDQILKDMVNLTIRTDLSKIQRKNLETCVTVHMHQRDTTEELIKKKVKDPTDFEWLKQARFYWKEDQNTVIISVCDVDLEYSYEYLGVKERLVITPLTDICYVTLTQALGMYLGGAPAGPAGTGKTETTKDLGNTLGKFVVVFNCSDQMNYKGMGKIYRGLAQSGLWGCFDEFNRINLDVLSVCAQQVFCVLSAIRENKKQFVFTDGSLVSLDPRVGFFITMNPGYAGRQELPENLKSLFRGVTMMVPNRQIIMKVKLAACGFQEYDMLSKKFFVLYGLCEQQLSKQAHYDFGLRNILSVLRTAGVSKRGNPDKSEAYLMMRTLRDMNMSKFVAEDVPLMLSLLADLFIGMKADRAEFPDVEKALSNVIRQKGLQEHPSWVNKCIQLYETYLVRHGIMVVGPSGGGKTAIIECLAGALTELGTKHVIWKMNPKAITAPQMFGKLDGTSGDWTDGIFAVLWRRAAKNKNHNTWILLDGPVDAIWIENLNTVLDDNKVLTLANGDRIQMGDHMKAMFEPENLMNASPATVSRAGIIYVSDTELGWKPVVESWLQTRSAQETAALKPIFDKYVDEVLDLIRLSLSPVMFNEVVSQITTLLKLLDGILKPFTEEGEALSEGHYERLFLYCLVWSIGGLLSDSDRPQLDEKLRSISDNMPQKQSESDTIYEYYVNDDDTEWYHWNDKIPSWEYPHEEENPKFAQLVIPTLDSVRFEALMQLNFAVGRPTLLVGGPGTAKTTSINQFIATFDAESVTNKCVTFSSLTTPQIFQQSVEGAVEKRQGRTYGPAGNKKMILFVDDISMPHINEWKDQVTNEIVRQLLEAGGMYSLEKPIGDMKFIKDVHYISAMNQPGGGKNDIPNRLKRQFSIYNVPPPSSAAIHNIFGALLTGRFSAEVVADEVAEVAQKLVPMTISLWKQIQAKMLPTPAKFHYLFNMRELSKVFQGVILAARDRYKKGADLAEFGAKVSSPEGYLLSLWQHECGRVFCDKLTCAEDKDWADNLITSLIKENCGPLLKQVEDPLYFVSFLRDPTVDEETGEIIDANPKFYESISGGLDELKDRVQKLQEQYNEESKVHKLELVLFRDALMHMMRISRILALDRGSALLVGVGGSGKQSLTRLAAYIAGAYTFQITITKTYNAMNLFEDIKNLYKIVGLKNKPVCFIFTDSEVKDEGFLEYINQLLMTGEVAGLFPKDELDVLLNDLRPIMKKESPSTIDTWDNLYKFFIGRVRDNLHVVLCFSPVGEQFSRRAMQFPGLINGCTIDWFLPWPEDALMAVSEKFISDFPMETADENKQQLIQSMGGVHTSVTKACTEYFEKYRRHVYVTPKSYLSFLDGFKGLYTQKLDETSQLRNKILGGLEKLEQAKVQVGDMKVDLAEKNKSLAVAQKEAAALLKEISANTAIAEKERTKVMAIVETVGKKAAEINAVKEDAEKDLAAAKPALEAAVSALNSITAKDIGALKALKNPPDIVKRIFDCVLLLRHKKCDKISWHEQKGAMVILGSYDEARTMMGDTQFLGALMDFPKEAINDETCELLQPYFTEDFTFDMAKKASGNVAGLCNWAKAMVTYHTVAKVVEPKIVALRESETELKIANKEKQRAEDNMAEVQSKLDSMQRDFDAAMANKQALEDDALACQRKMDSANALISALSGEEVRWRQQSKEFDDTIARFTGDCAVASAFVSYLGPFNKEFRELLVNRDFYGDCVKRNIPVTEGLQISKFLVEDAEVGEWNLQGLPTDELSVQNGIMVTRATRYPLLVDPQGQGKSWLVNREQVNGLVVISLTDKFFRNKLEDCLSFGKPMLIENIEETLDPVLDPVLDRAFIKKGKGFMIQLADKEVDFTPTFRLMCTTRLPNPHYTPELCAKVTVIDFTVTMVGLEDQLLGKLILKEKTELQEQKIKLMEEVNSYKKKIKQLEDDLLWRLSNSKGDLLDDPELIDVLANTKATSQEVGEKLVVASETNARITEACEEYRPVAHRASLMYFLIAEFAVVNVMYQTSLKQFDELYLLSIDRSDKAAMPSKRIKNIIDYLTYHIYLYIQRGLFERHKAIFALMLTNKVNVSAGTIGMEDVGIFLKGGGALDINTVRKKPKDWIPDTVWLDVVALSSMEVYKELADSIGRNDALWHTWYDCEAPEGQKIPDYDEKVNSFEKMCLLKAFRPDRVLIAAQEYIASFLGQQFVESVPLNMENTWKETTPHTPVICLLSPGADPTKLIEDLAKRKKIKTLGVSMGQGQEIVARKYISAAVIDGSWVVLQNTHLGLSYLSEVETFMTKADELHEDFRLWITAEPHPQFPIGLLQMSIKLTNEAPVGMKAGLRASYQWVNQDTLDAINRKEWRQLLFVMCYLHSITQERRKFGPIGWNIPYEFNQSDLSACVQFLQNHVMEMDSKKAAAPTWATIRYMVSDIQYGGRITDDFDQLLMGTYSERYFHQGILEQNVELFEGYNVPDTDKIEDFRKAIEDLPGQDNPELFGLHSNADLTFRSLQVADAISTITMTMPKSGGGGGGGLSREEQVDQIAADLLAKVPASFEVEDTKEKLKKLGITQPLTVFLRQEIDRLNTILNLSRTTLTNLRLAIAGTVALAGDLINALESLFNAKIPANWLPKSWDAGTLGMWFNGLLQRHEQLQKWLNVGRPKGFWLTGFFNPQGFLTAMKQEVTRKHAADKWALDDMVMTSEVTHPPKEFEQLRESPSEGVYVYGLYLDGCHWSGKENRLVDPEPKKLFSPLPVLMVTSVLAKNRSPDGVFEAPCYKVKKRTALNFITKFDLRTEDPIAKWVMRGVGLLCSVD